MNINPGFKYYYTDKKTAVIFNRRQSFYIHKYIEMQPAPIFSILEISEPLLQRCVLVWTVTIVHLSSPPQLLSSNEQGGWLAFVPGSWETLNPWNFTTDRSLLVIHGGPLGHIFLLTGDSQ